METTFRLWQRLSQHTGTNWPPHPHKVGVQPGIPQHGDAGGIAPAHRVTTLVKTLHTSLMKLRFVREKKHCAAPRHIKPISQSTSAAATHIVAIRCQNQCPAHSGTSIPACAVCSIATPQPSLVLKRAAPPCVCHARQPWHARRGGAQRSSWQCGIMAVA